jgi:TATA-binding protein-associated factor
MSDLFDVAWERRHGAAMVLREIIRAHGSGAGIDADASQPEVCGSKKLAS